MNKFPFFKSITVVFSLILFLSCDKDFNEVGSNIIGDTDFEFEKDVASIVNCYNQYDASVQSNNLPINLLGVYKDAGFGSTTASFVTQLELALIDTKFPVIPATAVIDEVILSVPYSSSLNSGTTDMYTLDKVKGTGKIKLSIFETTKYLNTLDGFTLLNKVYYSNEFNDFNNTTVGTRLNDSSTNVADNDEFVFSAAQQTEVEIDNKTGIPVKVTTNNITEEKSNPVAPRMKIRLNTSHFQNKFVGAIPASKMISNAVFKDYFRGLFFKVEQVGTENAMAQLDFSKGKIVVFYKDVATDVNRKTFTINMVRNTLNLYQNQYNPFLPTSVIPVKNNTSFYLKGGSGYHSYIDLFGDANDMGEIPKVENGIENPELKRLKDNNWIINEANLIFTVDNSLRTNITTNLLDEDPLRIYVYDAKNKRPIIDYLFDSFTNSSDPKNNKPTFGGVKYTENGLTKYKVRITNHLKNIINKDSTIVRLGLVVSDDINVFTNLFVKPSSPLEQNNYYNSIPQSSIVSPLGTILYGSDPNIDFAKRLKLEIFYTKPN